MLLIYFAFADTNVFEKKTVFLNSNGIFCVTAFFLLCLCVTAVTMVMFVIQDLKPESGFYNNMLGHFGHTTEVRNSRLTLYDHRICSPNDKLLLVCQKFAHTFPRYTSSLSRRSSNSSCGQSRSGASILGEVCKGEIIPQYLQAAHYIK